MGRRATRFFRAVSDEGEQFIVMEYQRIHEQRLLSGGTSTARGLKSFRLRDGSPVNQIDSETFEIVESNKIIRKLR